jgi:hypothetical protein
VPRLLEQADDGGKQQRANDALDGAAPVARVNLLARVAQ